MRLEDLYRIRFGYPPAPKPFDCDEPVEQRVLVAVNVHQRTGHSCT